MLNGGNADSDDWSERYSELTAFQRDILVILAADREYNGLAIKEALEDYYGEVVNHGRLYPNLDNLVEDGYISKYEIDDRTNGYELTPKGEDLLRHRIQWARSQSDGDTGIALEGTSASDLTTDDQSEEADSDDDSAKTQDGELDQMVDEMMVDLDSQSPAARDSKDDASSRESDSVHTQGLEESVEAKGSTTLLDRVFSMASMITQRFRDIFS